MAKTTGHVLLLPYPGQGHLNPMRQFARRLISKGLKATLLTTFFISNSMHFPPSIGSVTIDLISDGYDQGGFFQAESIDAYLASLQSHGSRTLSDLITKYKSTSNPVNCVVYEPFLPWALDVAKEHGLLGAAFFTQPCAVDLIYYYIRNGQLKLPVTSTPVSVPGLPCPMELKDLPSFLNAPDEYPAYFAMLVDQFSNADKADFILINTFYHLEKQVMDFMNSSEVQCPPVLAVGPTVPSIYLDNRIPDDQEYGVDLFKLEASISMNWLDTKPAGSVVYVAFGSLVDLSVKQMEELTWGFKRTDLYYLWVVKGGDRVPQALVELLGDKVLVVNWSPQVQVLANEAVGCFFTHSGWNSTIEALSLGVPMVAMPQWTDQPPNAKLVEDVWRVGVRVRVEEESGIVSREEVETRIREVMEGEKAEEIKMNAKKWKQLAVEAVSDGGTSDLDADRFVSHVMTSNSKPGSNLQE